MNRGLIYILFGFLLSACSSDKTNVNQSPKKLSSKQSVQRGIVVADSTTNESNKQSDVEQSIAVQKESKTMKPEPAPIEEKKKKKVAPKKKVTKKQKRIEKPKTSTKEVKKEKPLTEIIFKRNFFNFGEITKGDTIDFKYAFTNMGEVPLLITDATATCGCTWPEYPKEAILPGESGEITGKYISTNKQGPQNAMVKVVANTDPPIHKLILEGKVLLPKETEEEIEEVIDTLKN